MLDRFSIRAKLTAAFAGAMVVVLALAALFVYVRVESALTEQLDEGLQTRANDLVPSIENRKEPPGSTAGHIYTCDCEQFTDVLISGSRKTASLRQQARSPLGRGNVERALSGPIFITKRSRQGQEGDEYRYYARPVPSGDQFGLIVVGTPTEDRDETLVELRWTFVVGTPIALLLASGLGYLVAGRALAPVASMRRRASEITLERSGERLPLPRADDEIHQLGATLNTMLDRIEASLEREREFVADAGHELRTPLAILRAELELAEREGRSPEELRAAISSAAEETDRLSQLAEDLLVIARSDQGRLPIKREAVDLERLLERVRNRFAQRAADVGRDLSIDFPDGARADLDPLRMEQALGNLVDNALRHGAGRVEMTAAVEDGRTVFAVRDQGAGFSDDFAERAFERFSRADEGRTSGGAGLGLAIVQAIAKAHGGDARIDGAGVVLTLPA